MKKITLMPTLLSFILILGMLGCVKDDEKFIDNNSVENETIQTRANVSLSEAMYHAETESWISPRQDPYTLNNFQKAYDNILSGRASIAVSQDVIEELSKTKLLATHYNLKIYPKTEKEQFEIEQMEDITVSYIPFNYVQLPENITKDLPIQAEYSEKGIYTQTFEDVESTEGPIEPYTITLPILYAVWPVNKSFPANMHYEILYEVFLPEKTLATRSISTASTAIQLLEETAIKQASDGPYSLTRAVTWNSATARGEVRNSDNIMSGYMPVANLKIRYQLGSQVWETYTGSDGKFFISTTIPRDANLSFIFQHPKWKLTTDKSTTAYTLSRGLHMNNYPNADFFGFVSFPIMEVHRAINFFYNNSHTIAKWSYSSGIRVIVLDYVHSNWSGLFTYSTNNNAYISISNSDDCGQLMGTTLHELGHWVQYCMKGSNFNTFKNCHNLIKESWASYVGWYLGELYYSTLGWTKTYNFSDITSQARQSWRPITSGYYSPLFVDLRDNYNQNNTDNIQDVSFSAINDIGEKATDIPSCKSLIISHIGNNYSSTVINNFFAPYNEYVNPNAIQLYPNPTSGILNIKLGGEIFGTLTIKIYDSASRLIYTTTLTNTIQGNVMTITNLGSLTPGVYTLQINYTGNSSNPSGTTSGTFIKR